MSYVMKMLMGGAAITTTVFVGYKINTSTMKKNCSHEQAGEKIKTALWFNVDRKYPIFYDSYWKKIGQVDNLSIHPTKKISVFFDLFKFHDYGCRREFETYFWNGISSVYHKTIGKFVNSRSYPLLRVFKAQLTNTDEITLSSDGICDIIKLNIDEFRNPANRFVKEKWNETLNLYGLDLSADILLKNLIDVKEINGDLMLVVMPPHKWESKKNNWFRFLHGYEDKKTSKAINKKFLTPNIIVKIDEESKKLFEEKTWIKIGNDVILRRVKPVLSCGEKNQHYYILWSGGNVKKDDEVRIYYHHDIYTDEDIQYTHQKLKSLDTLMYILSFMTAPRGESDLS